MSETLVKRALDGSELTIGQAIELLRRNKGQSARALSLMSGLSSSYVSKVEKGEVDPSLRAFACIVESLGLSPREVHSLVTRAGMDR